MKHGTKIEWTFFPGYKGETWNPITGCSACSIGCDHCYAERISKRFGWPWGKPIFHPERLVQSSYWRKPRAIFVCSMSDLFHPELSWRTINEVWMQMFNNPRHLFLILTKRPEVMLEWTKCASRSKKWPINEIWPDNVWLGVTAENQQTADERIPILLQTPCAHRFVSVEPMLEAVNIEKYLAGVEEIRRGDTITTRPVPYLDWVICGGESGPGARPMFWEWPAYLLDQCERAGIPFFMKQMSQHGGFDRHDIPSLLNVKEFPEVNH